MNHQQIKTQDSVETLFCSQKMQQGLHCKFRSSSSTSAELCTALHPKCLSITLPLSHQWHCQLVSAPCSGSDGHHCHLPWIPSNVANGSDQMDFVHFCRLGGWAFWSRSSRCPASPVAFCDKSFCSSDSLCLGSEPGTWGGFPTKRRDRLLKSSLEVKLIVARLCQMNAG